MPVLSSESGKHQQGRNSVELPPATQPVKLPPVSKIASATDDSTIFVNCRLNGYHVKALIDTGAAVTIMQEDLFPRIKTKETRVRQSTKTIVGGK